MAPPPRCWGKVETGHRCLRVAVAESLAGGLQAGCPCPAHVEPWHSMAFSTRVELGSPGGCERSAAHWDFPVQHPPPPGNSAQMFPPTAREDETSPCHRKLPGTGLCKHTGPVE